MIEERLRAGARELAGFAPDGTDLAGRIIAASQPSTKRARSRKRTVLRDWAIPVAAALVVGLLLAGGVVGITKLRENAAAPAATEVKPVTPKPAPTLPKIIGFQASDVSFINANDGWAIGVWQCSLLKCTALLRTHDGGQTWTQVPVTGLSLQAKAGTHIRFANAQDGYAYNNSGLVMTTDAGLSWRSVAGGADQLVIAGNTVLRMAHSYVETKLGTECIAACNLPTLLLSVAGSDQWHEADYESAIYPPGYNALDTFQWSTVSMSASGSTVAMMVDQGRLDPSGFQYPSLVTSPDSGRTWTYHRGDPCPGIKSSNIEVSVAPDSSVALVCPSGPTDHPSLRRSIAPGADTAAPINPVPLFVQSETVTTVTALSEQVDLVLADRLYRIDQTGATTPGTGPVQPSTIDVISSTDVMALANNRLWTSTDAALTWTSRVVAVNK